MKFWRRDNSEKIKQFMVLSVPDNTLAPPRFIQGTIFKIMHSSSQLIPWSDYSTKKAVLFKNKKIQ